MVELRPGGKDHRSLPSNVGQDEASRPEWIGVAPELKDRRAYLRSYIRWANGHNRDWERANRGNAERMTAQVRVKEGEENIGVHRWDCMVDATLWNMSFANPEPRPEVTPITPRYPWKGSSNTEGGYSMDFWTLRREYLAELQGLPARQVEASLVTKDGQKLKPVPPKAQAEQMFGGGKGKGASVKAPPRGGLAPRGGPSPRGGNQQHNAAAGPSGSKGSGPTQGPGVKTTLVVRQPPLVDAKTPAPLANAISKDARLSFAALAHETPAPDMRGSDIKGKRWADSSDEEDESFSVGLSSSMYAPGNRLGDKQPAKAQVKVAEAAVVKVAPEVKQPSGVEAKLTQSLFPVVRLPKRIDAKKKDGAKEVKDEAIVGSALLTREPDVEVWEHEGKLYRQPPVYYLDRDSRVLLYERVCFGDEAGDDPFELELPEGFDFEGLVWGKDGADWEYIQKNYIRGEAIFTWGYKGGIPKEASAFKGVVDKGRMADVGYVLTVGRRNLGENEVEDANVLTVWQIILRWYECFRQHQQKPLKFLFYDYHMEPRRVAMAARGPTPEGWKGVQSRVVPERNLRTAEIKEILDKGGADVGDSLQEWLVETSSNSSLSRRDRLEMACLEWFEHGKEEDELQGLLVEKWRTAMLAKFRRT